MLLRTCVNNIKSALIPRPKTHIRFHMRGVQGTKQSKRRHEVLVLNPENITNHNQPTIDLSGNRHVIFSFFDDAKYRTVRLYYWSKEKNHIPFPENSKGYLYYRTPSQDRPRLSGSFRFRVLPSTSDPPKDFGEGTDLLRPDGRPWELSLYNAVHSSGFAPLIRKTLNEKLLEPDLIDVISKLPQTSLKRNSSGVLYTLSDPFTLSLGQTKIMTVMTEERLENFRYRPLLDLGLNRYPFTGTVLARFEKSDLPEHMRKRVVVTRILEILSPINCVIPDYDFNVQMPEAGQLVAKRKLSGRYGNYHPWAIDISDGTGIAKCLALLFPESI